MSSHLRLLDPVFGDHFENTLRRFLTPTQMDTDAPALKMRIDVTENEQGYQVKADLPGVKKEDIHIRIEGNVVAIEAESRSEKDTPGEGGKVLRSERYYGTISRTFSLASEVDDTRVEARYADGVLNLVLPRKATAASRKITVQ